MTKLSSSHVAKKKASSTRNGIINLKVVAERLQKSFNLLLYKPSSPPKNKVPKDVKEGHIAVIAVVEDEEKRFIVPLSYLTYPSFLTLLEEAGEEYGFGHEGGAITIPCRPSHLEKMFEERESGVAVVEVKWELPEIMVASY